MVGAPRPNIVALKTDVIKEVFLTVEQDTILASIRINYGVGLQVLGFIGSERRRVSMNSLRLRLSGLRGTLPVPKYNANRAGTVTEYFLVIRYSRPEKFHLMVCPVLWSDVFVCVHSL